MHFVANFFTGAFLCNALPHLAAALQGATFPSPFAKPPGEGDSSPLVNFLWGSLNLAFGLGLFMLIPPDRAPASLAVVALGWLAMGLQLSLHFGKVQAKKRGQR